MRHSCGCEILILDLKNIKVAYCPHCRYALHWDLIG